MRRTLCISLAVALVAAGAALAGSPVKVSKMAFVTFEGSADIAAAPDAVWSTLTDPVKFVSWCPMWKDAKNAQPLTAVGNAVAFTDDYGNGGKSVVVYVDKGKELRVANVPNDGSYVCQFRIVLTPNAGGTTVAITEQYSDALNVPTDRDTAASAKAELTQTMNALKALCEKS